jgi:pyroglutamyl-peptidase
MPNESDEAPIRILVTGFVSAGIGINASDVVVRSLINDLPTSLIDAKHLLRFRLVDASTDDLQIKLEALLREVRPTDCVFVGQAPGRNNITLERAATNLRFTGPPLRPDDAPQSDVIHLGGPDVCTASMLNMDALVEKLRAAGIPAALSNDAGNNLCNQILYEGLQYAQQHVGQPRCGFVHIPALPQQVIERWPDYPFMPLDMTRAAIAIILLEIVRVAGNARDSKEAGLPSLAWLIRLRLNEAHHRRGLHFIHVIRFGRIHTQLIRQFLLADRDQREAFLDALNRLVRQGAEIAALWRDVFDHIRQCLAHGAQDALFFA